MTRFTTLGILRTLALLAFVATAVIGPAQSRMSSDGSASVTVLRALTLTEVTPMRWGSVWRPESGTADYTLNYETGAVTLSANSGAQGSFVVPDDGESGVWSVTGEPSIGVSYDLAIGSFNGTGVSVEEGFINGNHASGAGTLDGSGHLLLRTGGVIRVGSSASLGVQTATVTVTINYS